jgi:hypothetical protein
MLLGLSCPFSCYAYNRLPVRLDAMQNNETDIALWTSFHVARRSKDAKDLSKLCPEDFLDLADFLLDLPTNLFALALAF